MPNVINLEVFEGKRPTASPASRVIPTTTASPAPAAGEAAGHYASSRVVKCWSCGGISYAVCDDTLANQAFTCATCGQLNQL